jgi:2-polyprenyl-3-methyl-5-hydroxy-6-metoxy-1,4-benzoquinol methylase
VDAPPVQPPDRCPLCGGELQCGGWSGTTQLGSWPLSHCPACRHTCCPPAYAAAPDYDALYGNEYAAQQLAPLQDPARRPLFVLLPPYAMFFRRLGPARGRSLFDFGCGAGRFLLAARGQGWVVRGSEPAAPAVAAARALGLPVGVETPAELAAAGERFAVVTAFDVLEHLADPVAALTSLRPLLAPGGTLFATVPNWASPLMQQATRGDWLPPVHLQFFSEHSLRTCLDRAGLAVRAQGLLASDPAPPLAMPWAGRTRLLALPWLKWATRRLRGLAVHQPQLWIEAHQP